MSSYIVKKIVSKKVVHEFGVQDPYFKEVKTTLADGTVKVDRVKRETPEGLTPQDEKVLAKIKKRAYRLELFFSVFGFNVGWTAVIGLIPILGDLWVLYLGYGTIRLAEKIEGGLTNWERSRMTANVAIDAGLGFIPILGDVCQAVYKGNTRNANILEEVLEKRGKANIKKGGANLGSLTTRGHVQETPDGRDHLK